jgi:hypothetical protein
MRSAGSREGTVRYAAGLLGAGRRLRAQHPSQAAPVHVEGRLRSAAERGSYGSLDRRSSREETSPSHLGAAGACSLRPALAGAATCSSPTRWSATARWIWCSLPSTPRTWSGHEGPKAAPEIRQSACFCPGDDGVGYCRLLTQGVVALGPRTLLAASLTLREHAHAPIPKDLEADPGHAVAGGVIGQDRGPYRR